MQTYRIICMYSYIDMTYLYTQKCHTCLSCSLSGSLMLSTQGPRNHLSDRSRHMIPDRWGCQSTWHHSSSWHPWKDGSKGEAFPRATCLLVHKPINLSKYTYFLLVNQVKCVNLAIQRGLHLMSSLTLTSVTHSTAWNWSFGWACPHVCWIKYPTWW